MRTLLLFIFLVSAVLFNEVSTACPPEQAAFAELVANKHVTVTGPFTVASLEKENVIQIRETGKSLPFGYAYAHWRKLKAAIRPGDNIYFMVNVDGRFYEDGHILVRGECVIEFLRGKIS